MPIVRFATEPIDVSGLDPDWELSEHPADPDPGWGVTWTKQPEGGDLHVDLVGSVANPTPLGSLDRALDERNVEASLAERLPTSFGLRDYQEEAITAVVASWRAGKVAPLIVLPTASGKTIISAELIARVHAVTKGKCLFFAHRDNLLEQTAEKLRFVSTDTRVGIVKAELNELGREVTVASIQTLGRKGHKRLAELIERGPYELLVLDEAHHSVSEQWRGVIKPLREAFPQMRIMGMTATPGREDGLALDLVFDDVAYTRDVFEMIAAGWLVPPRGVPVRIDVDLDRVEVDDKGDFKKASLSKFMNTPHVNVAVVEAWVRYAMQRKTLVFTIDIKHAEALVLEFKNAGISAEVIHSQMKKKATDAALNRFREGETKVLVNVEVLTEGSDIPSIECLLFARPTQSQALYVQCVGRGLRLYPGKTECIVIDCVGNGQKHKLVQLANLAGFEPDRPMKVDITSEEENPENELLLGMDPQVIAARIRDGYDAGVQRRMREAKYKWRETTSGWILEIPRIGYYLVAWHGTHQNKATVRFYDQRKGKRDLPPREITKTPLEFEMLYGLVEAEMDRLMRAKSDYWAKDKPWLRRDRPEDEDEPAPLMSFIDLDEGVDEAVFVPEELVMADAEWRYKAVSSAQEALLVKMGVKAHSMPETSGEASDLITILRAEKDSKLRMPATEKQIKYLRRWKMEIPENLTKGKAASLIWTHRKKKFPQDHPPDDNDSFPDEMQTADMFPDTHQDTLK